MNQSYFPLGGTDYLELWTDATIEIQGVTDTVEMTGKFTVNRSNVDPESKNHIVTQILMMNARGESKQFGPVIAYLNPEWPSFGNKAALVNDDDEHIGFYGYFDVMFELRALASGITLFNKEPVHIKATARNLPPIGALGVTEEGRAVDLYDRANPDGPPVGKMLTTRKKVGAYVDLSYEARRVDREQVTSSPKQVEAPSLSKA